MSTWVIERLNPDGVWEPVLGMVFDNHHSAKVCADKFSRAGYRVREYRRVEGE